jgi:dUTP pyrophosphatase
MVIKPVELPEVIEVEELDETERGGKGFGSTGKK